MTIGVVQQVRENSTAGINSAVLLDSGRWAFGLRRVSGFVAGQTKRTVETGDSQEGALRIVVGIVTTAAADLVAVRSVQRKTIDFAVRGRMEIRVLPMVIRNADGMVISQIRAHVSAGEDDSSTRVRSSVTFLFAGGDGHLPCRGVEMSNWPLLHSVESHGAVVAGQTSQ